MSENALQELEQEGAPKSRLNDPRQAHEYAKVIIRDNERRNRVAASVSGLLDGNPPYAQSALDAAGQKYRSNFNTGSGEAFLEVGVTAYYDLFSEVPHFAQVVCEIDGMSTDQRDELGRVLTAEFDKLQREDSTFDANMQLSQGEMLAFGSGPLVWDKEDSFSPKSRRHTTLLVPDDTSAVLDDWDSAMLDSLYPTTELYRYVENEKAASAVGWNVEATKKAIMRSADNQSPLDARQWAKVQESIRANDLAQGRLMKQVRVARIFYREYPTRQAPLGKISEKWIAYDFDDLPFLYQREAKIDRWQNIVAPFMLNRGRGTYHSIKGIGRKMYRLMVAQERLYNQFTDLGFSMSSIHVQSDTGGAIEKNAIKHAGPYVFVKSGLTPFNFNVAPGIDAANAVLNSQDRLLSGNLAQFRPQVEQPRGNPRTAFEVAANVAQQSVLQKTNITRYFEQLDDFYAERWRRAVRPPGRQVFGREAELLRNFNAKVRRLGIPQSMLSECRVTANRTVGQGSSFQRKQLLAEIMSSVGPSLPESGRTKLIEMFVAATAGQPMVERLIPNVESDRRLEEQAALARLELGALKDGILPVVTGLQNHVVHLESHLLAALEASDGLTDGADPLDLLIFLQVTSQHVREHLARLGGDPLRNGDISKFQSQLQQLDVIVKGVADLVKKKQEGEEEQTQATEKMQLDRAKVQSDIELDRLKTDAKIENDRRLTDAQVSKTLAGGNGSR